MMTNFITILQNKPQNSETHKLNYKRLKVNKMKNLNAFIKTTNKFNFFLNLILCVERLFSFQSFMFLVNRRLLRLSSFMKYCKIILIIILKY